VSVALTLIVRVKDWQALARLNDTQVLAQAQRSGVSRYRVYRNAHDASQVLFIFELPSHAGLEWLRSEGLNECLSAVASASDEWEWEALGCRTIG